MTDSAITLNDLCFGFGEGQILRNVSLTIQKGEFIGIIGPNGGGKTTLLRLFMGLLEPTCGSIQLFGQSPRRSRERIAYVPQASVCDRLFPLTVEELVLSGRLNHLTWYGRYQKKDRELTEEALKTVQLYNKKDRSFGTLSGGEAKRALLARALVSQPDLLLLDEPTAMVDVDAEAVIHQIIREQFHHVTLVMVTHHLPSIVDMVDRVFLVQGEVKEVDPHKICEHFAMGVYHNPLLLKPHQHRPPRNS